MRRHAAVPARIGYLWLVLNDSSYSIRLVGHVSSTLTDPAQAPLQGDEAEVDAWIVIDEPMRPAAADLRPGGIG